MAVSSIPPPPPTQARASSTFRPPPLDGSLTLPEIFDWHLVNTPNHRLFIFPKEDGSLRTINWPEAVRAVHQGSRIVRKRMNWSAGMTESQVVAILAPSDAIPYFTVMMSIMRANYIVFPISPRNSPEAVAHLISKAEVKHVLVGREQSMLDLADAALNVLKEKYPSTLAPELSPMPLFEELFLPSSESASAGDLPYEKPLPNAKVMILHSSGSTAFPKPVPMTAHRLVAWCLIPWFGERDLTNQVLSLHVMPMYHGMGTLQMSWTASCGLVASTFEPKSPTPVPTADALFRDAKACNSDIIFCVPSFIEVWARQPEYIKWLATRGGVLYGGGPLNKEAGDHLTAQGVSIFILYGCTEGGIMSPILPASSGSDWDYFKFPQLITPKMLPNGNNSFEFVMVSNEYNQLNVFNTKVDGRDAYATSDLLMPHPTKPGYWRVFGRTDDQIMHNTGEKTNPGPLENILNQDPCVQSSVMFGRGRFQAGILVDPKQEFKFDPANPVKLAEFRNKIWPTVERMNVFAPQHSRLFKEMIIVAKPSKPFTYTAKNTARRQAVINAYDEEINAAYDLVDESAQANIPLPSHWDVVTTNDFIRAVVVKVLGHHVDDDDDLFQHGCDSLQATWIRNTILRALRDSAQLDVRQNVGNFVYEYPTIARLAAFIVAFAFGTGVETDVRVSSKVDMMRAMAAKYTDDFPTRPSSAGVASLKQSGDVVLLTGTTGSLGCHILVHLVADRHVSRVYALNRASKSGAALLDRQKAALLERGLDASILHSDKVVLLEGDLLRDYFGVSDGVYEKMHQSVTHIIHNAWRVDFNLSLISFESNVRGLRHLIDFALSSPTPEPPQLMYTSSIGVFQNVQVNGVLPEAAIEPEVAVGSGYTESKWVSEQMLSEAAAKTALKPLVVRVGQLTGGLDGAWNVNEWFPSLVQTAAATRYFPDDDRDVNWIPLDAASRAIVDFRKVSGVTLFVHLTHPRPVSWSSLTSTLCSELSAKLVPYVEWLAVLEDVVQPSAGALDRVDVALLRQYHALRLLPFFKNVATKGSAALAMGFPDLSVARATASSPTLADPQLRELGPEDVHKWLAYWRQVGLLL